jgi:transcriptional regulator with XRE-family HTH domain
MGMTQKELAILLDVTQTYVCNLENGRFRPGPHLATRLQEILGVPRDLLRPDVFCAPVKKPVDKP